MMAGLMIYFSLSQIVITNWNESRWGANGWTVITSEIGYIAKMFPELSEEQRQEVGEFLQALEDNDDVHRVSRR